MGIPLYVTDIQPGFVDTKMAKGPGFWVSSPQKPPAKSSTPSTGAAGASISPAAGG
ncbi:hypothetical protein ACQ86N_27035 [Puia sp. P3]|uniref:hypothetical protein n=1 Tax=Puia sp. P3 TaxID=3423952 RepID=UPI003D67ADE0